MIGISRMMNVASLVVLFCFFQPAPAAAFATADLAGTWHVSAFSDIAGVNNADAIGGSFTVNSSGTVTGGSLTDVDGDPISVTGGSLSLNADGVLSGTILTNDGSPSTVTITGGALDNSKNLMTFVANTSPDVSRSFVTGIKGGGSFSTADLAGQWRIVTFADLSSGNEPDAASGTITLDSSGNVTGGAFTDSENLMTSVTGGMLTSNGSGVLTGSIVLNDGGPYTITVVAGKLNADKNQFTMVLTDSETTPIIANAIKTGGSYTTSNLAGTWRYFTFADTIDSVISGGNPVWTTGTVAVDSSGNVTAGTYADSEGGAATVTGASSFAITGAGIVTGTLVLSSGVTITIVDGQMRDDETFLSMKGSDSNGFRFIGNAVKQAASAPVDFDGDGVSDFGLYNTSTGGWSIIRSSDSGLTYVPWGGPGWEQVPGDYDGDGKTDIAVRNGSGLWSILRSSDSGNTLFQWSAAAGDEVVRGDFDGDGKNDFALYNATTAGWSIIRSSDSGLTYVPWGGPGWEQVPGDYDGDGKTDIAVRNGTGLWSIRRSSDSGNTLFQWSAAVGDEVVKGDFDGDGKADFALYNSNTAGWSIIRSSDSGLTYVPWGGTGWQAVPGDYDGDGKTDIAVRNASGLWSVRRSSDSGNTLLQWSAAAGDEVVQ